MKINVAMSKLKKQIKSRVAWMWRRSVEVYHACVGVMHHVIESLNYKRWRNYPLGKEPRGEKEDYNKRFENAKNHRNNDVRKYEEYSGVDVPYQFIEKVARNIQISLKQSEPDYDHGRVLYVALSDYISKKLKPKESVTVIETGTAKGYSAICMAKAIEDSDVDGKVVTFDILPHRVPMYWNVVGDHDYGERSRESMLAEWSQLIEDRIYFIEGDTQIMLPKFHATRINFAFLDGGHSYEDVLFEFETIKDKQKKGDVVVLDDYNEKDFPGIVRAIDEVCGKYGYKMNKLPLRNDRYLVIASKM